MSLYADEMMFAAQAPTNIRDKFKLVFSTLGFHLRNWRKAPVDPFPRMNIGMCVDGYKSSITLRPHDGDLAILHEIFVRGAYAIPDELLPPGSVRTVVDAGSNIGVASIYLAGRYRNARVLSIEPNPENFSLLQRNICHDKRIIPIQACLTAKADQDVYITNEGRGSHFFMNTEGNGVRVRGMSISQLCEEHDVEQIDLLKMDVEGAEQEIFADASFLSKVRVVAAELHGDYTLSRFNEDITRWGFRAWSNDKAKEQGLVLAART
jgi:FkbM family methyltransferase